MKLLVSVAALSILVHVGAVATPELQGVTVPAGGDLQAAINRARPGDLILLEPAYSTSQLFGAFVDSASGDYRLRPASVLRTAATDGSIIGADVDAINRVILVLGSPGIRQLSRRRR